MAGRRVISEQLRRELDEVPVKALAEYWCARMQLDEGEKVLLFFFRNGRYDRMKRFAAIEPGYPSRSV